MERACVIRCGGRHKRGGPERDVTKSLTRIKGTRASIRLSTETDRRIFRLEGLRARRRRESVWLFPREIVDDDLLDRRGSRGEVKVWRSVHSTAGLKYRSGHQWY